MPSNNPRSNQPTAPFGGPPNRRSTTSIAITLIALVVFGVLQMSKGGLGNLFGGAVESTAQPTQTMPVAQVATVHTNSARATATPRSTPTPKASSANQPRPTRTPRPTALSSPTANAPPVVQVSDLPTVALADLPTEAQQTVSLIDQGGPFPYSRDGVAFENRERILPRQPKSYYHEYTVVTPGSSDRGARRVIMGQGGEMYYTDDHYATFREIVR